MNNRGHSGEVETVDVLCGSLEKVALDVETHIHSACFAS
jgi:hypothetical protein